jgi:hypothetical protein
VACVGGTGTSLVAPSLSQPLPEGGLLENRANNSATAGQSHDQDWGAARWDLRRVLWKVTSLKRVALCQRYMIDKDAGVQVRSRDGVVGYSGLTSCGSIWCCPPCNARITAHRRLEVALGLANALGEGSSAAFGAYTLRHHAGQRLNGLWPALSACWNAVAMDRRVREVRADLGAFGLVRAAEVTVGANGWHPHLHPVHLFDREVSFLDVADLHAEQFRAWSASAHRLGLDAPLAIAQELHLVVGDGAANDLAAYAVKAVSWEMTSTQTKSRTRAEGSRTPWDVLRSVVDDGDADDLDLWHDWEAASKGKKALTWSRGLRARLGLEVVEESDEDIVGRSVGGAEDAGLVVTDWAPIRAAPRLGGALLSVVRSGGWDAARAFCDTNEIPYRDPEPVRSPTHEASPYSRTALGLASSS